MHLALPIIPPENKKSCSRCRVKRVKCDMALPTCERCRVKGDICDICDMVFYSFSAVQSLQATIEELQQKLATVKLQNEGDKGNIFTRQSEFNKTVGENLLVEVGSLSSLNNQYIGTASGVAFVKMFLSQINLPRLMKMDKNHFNLDKLNPNISNLQISNIPVISLPSRKITKYLLEVYIEHIHIFYPIIDINYIARSIEDLYNRSTRVSANDKYLIFMVLSISSGFADATHEYIELNDLNTSREYFCMAFNYFESAISIINISSIRNILLLIIWCLCLKNLDENENLWLLTRHVTSLCVELGLHRNNPRWKLDTTELEMRNRLWWTCFILERLISLQTGRTLSIRNYAIDAEIPRFIETIDSVKDEFGLVCPFYDNVCFQPMCLLAKVRTIAGDILESVYIARGKNKTLAVESVYKSASRLREELDLWLESVMDLYSGKNNWIYENLKLNYDIYSLVLSRPSPSFPNISISSSKICLNDSKSFIDVVANQINKKSLLDFWFISANIITVAVTFLFSSWVLDAEFSTTKAYIGKIQMIINFLSGFSTSELSNIEVFNSAAIYTLEHLTDSEDCNLEIQNTIRPYRTGDIEDDEERKLFILDYLLNITDTGPFYLVRDGR